MSDPVVDGPRMGRPGVGEPAALVDAVIALGSNLPPRGETLRSAVRALARLPRTRLVATSPWRETAPVDAPPGSGPFLNGAALLSTGLEARALLAALQRIEAEHGRTREVPNGPRTLDLDLVLFGGLVHADHELVLPHPRAHLRAFVLEPAADVAPHLVHPVLGRTLAALRDDLRDDLRVGPPAGEPAR